MFSTAFKAFGGSGITSGYNISPNHSFIAGPWSVYNGKSKSTGEAVSVFMFDKRRLMASISGSGSSKRSENDVYERLRREVASLAKLRHPALVKLIAPLEESKGTMRFVTEPLTSCLQHMIDVNSSNAGSSELEGDLDDIVIQKGVLQLAEGLDFLHSAAGLVHLDIQPSSILINSKGDWKLFGLGFVENYRDGVKEYFIPRFDPRLPSFIQINLDYAAPELILEHSLDISNDIFSLGCLIIAMFTFRPPMRTDNNPNIYKQEFAGISKILRDSRIPQYLHEMIPLLVARYPAQRLTLEQFKNSPLFDNILIRTINFLDDFPAKLPSEQQAFMNGFSKLIDQFPKSVLQKKILPTLLEELGKEESLVGPILVNVFEVGKDMSQLGFSEKILPGIRRVNKILSAQVSILKYLDTLKSRLNVNEFRDDILPIVLETVETAPPEVQEVALQKLPIVIGKMDFITLKNEVFPKVGEVFAKTTSLAVKLEALGAFEILVNGGLDKYAVTEKLLPLLNGMKTREPKVMMGALSVYSKVINIVDIEVLARVIVPQLLSMSMESMLNLAQFRAFMDQIKMLLDRIEKEHAKRLSQVHVDPASSKGQKLQVSDGEETVNFEDMIYGRKKSASQSFASTAVINSQPTSPLESLNIESFTKPSLQSLQPSQSYTLKPLSTENKMSSLQPSQSSFLGSKGIIPPLQSSQLSVPLQPPSNWQPPAQSKPNMGFGNTTSTGSSSLSNWNSLRTTVPISNPPSIDWSKATQPKPPDPFSNFGQNKILSSPPIVNAGNWGTALKPEPKYHINRRSSNSQDNLPKTNTNQNSLI